MDSSPTQQFLGAGVPAANEHEEEWTGSLAPRWTHGEGLFDNAALQEVHSRFPRDARLALIGVFCRAEDIVARTIIRRTSAQLAPPGVTIRFVICVPMQSKPNVLLWAEMQGARDIFLMDCVENMDEGKSVQYFKEVRRRYPGYAFYAKADTDSYVLYHNLAIALSTAPRALFYGGRSNFGVNSRHTIHNMSGSLYVLSRDLVEAFEACRHECEDRTGFEDWRTGKILQLLMGDSAMRLGDLGRNHSILYNHWDPATTPVHPWLVLVHPVKDAGFWWDLHVTFTRLVTKEAVRAASHHDFFDGAHSRNARDGPLIIGGGGTTKKK